MLGLTCHNSTIMTWMQIFVRVNPPSWHDYSYVLGLRFHLPNFNFTSNLFFVLHKEASWLRLIVADVLGLKKDPTLPLTCDNDGTIAFSHNQSINRRNKHIDIAYHFVRDAIRREVFNLEQCATSEMTADIFTKPLGRVLFQKFVGYLGLHTSTDPKSM